MAHCCDLRADGLIRIMFPCLPSLSSPSEMGNPSLLGPTTIPAGNPVGPGGRQVSPGRLLFSVLFCQNPIFPEVLLGAIQEMQETGMGPGWEVAGFLYSCLTLLVWSSGSPRREVGLAVLQLRGHD